MADTDFMSLAIHVWGDGIIADHARVCETVLNECIDTSMTNGITLDVLFLIAGDGWDGGPYIEELSPRLMRNSVYFKIRWPESFWKPLSRDDRLLRTIELFDRIARAGIAKMQAKGVPCDEAMLFESCDKAMAKVTTERQAWLAARFPK
jgi:hypothetical protein